MGHGAWRSAGYLVVNRLASRRRREVGRRWPGDDHLFPLPLALVVAAAAVKKKNNMKQTTIGLWALGVI
jgi:hypothetical protein